MGTCSHDICKCKLFRQGQKMGLDIAAMTIYTNRHHSHSASAGNPSCNDEPAGQVESECDAVAVGRTYLLPPLSSGGALVVSPWLRFHIPLIEPDRQISRIRLSDKTLRFRVQRLLQFLTIYRS